MADRGFEAVYNKQTDRRADDTNTLKFLSPLPVDFLLSATTPSHLSLSLSLLPWSLAVMLLWLHSKGYAVYPPSLPVTPPPPPPATQTRTHSPSVPGPVNGILSVESPTYQTFPFAKRMLW